MKTIQEWCCREYVRQPADFFIPEMMSSHLRTLLQKAICMGELLWWEADPLLRSDLYSKRLFQAAKLITSTMPITTRPSQMLQPNAVSVSLRDFLTTTADNSRGFLLNAKRPSPVSSLLTELIKENASINIFQS